MIAIVSFVALVAAGAAAPDMATAMGRPHTSLASVATLVSPSPCVVSYSAQKTVVIRVDGMDGWKSPSVAYDANIIVDFHPPSMPSGQVQGLVGDSMATPGKLLTISGTSYTYSFTFAKPLYMSGAGDVRLSLFEHREPNFQGARPGTAYDLGVCKFVNQVGTSEALASAHKPSELSDSQPLYSPPPGWSRLGAPAESVSPPYLWIRDGAALNFWRALAGPPDATKADVERRWAILDENGALIESSVVAEGRCAGPAWWIRQTYGHPDKKKFSYILLEYRRGQSMALLKYNYESSLGAPSQAVIDSFLDYCKSN